MRRVTLMVSAELMDAANHVHVLMGKSQNLNSYTVAGWTDGANLFAVSSGLWTDAQIAGVQNPVVIAAMVEVGNIPGIVDFSLVAQAQAAFALHTTADADGEPLPIPQAALGLIVAVVGNNPHAILAASGLARVADLDEGADEDTLQP